MMDEFELINTYFGSLISNRSSIIKTSIGDDAAIVETPNNYDLAISTDTMVENVHFLKEWPAKYVAYKLIASNVSDMVAMAAKPQYVTLALTLPELNQQWLEGFHQGLKHTLKHFEIDLVGGDVTCGPCTLSITIHGLVSKDAAIMRSGAQNNDRIFITGDLGGPGYALSQLKNFHYSHKMFNKLVKPKPRIEFIEILEAFATSAIDVSDGLASDLNHVLKASQKGAKINYEQLPVTPLLDNLDDAQRKHYALNSGDEYELCFTVAESQYNDFIDALKQQHLVCTEIGKINSSQKFELKLASGEIENILPKGYKHFV